MVYMYWSRTAVGMGSVPSLIQKNLRRNSENLPTHSPSNNLGNLPLSHVPFRLGCPCFLFWFFLTVPPCSVLVLVLSISENEMDGVFASRCVDRSRAAWSKRGGEVRSRIETKGQGNPPFLPFPSVTPFLVHHYPLPISINIEVQKTNALHAFSYIFFRFLNCFYFLNVFL